MSQGTRYVVKRRVLGEPGEIELTKDEYKAIQQARSGLFFAIASEERLDNVLANYLEFERDVLAVALRRSVEQLGGWSDIANDRQNLGRRIENLLSTSYAYLEQTRGDLIRHFGRRSLQLERFEQSIASESARNRGFRLLKVFRGYVQHSGPAVQALTYHTRWREEEERAVLEFSVNPQVVVDTIHERERSRGEMKESLAELRSIGESVDLRPLVREHVQGIGVLHEGLRKSASTEVESWLTTWEKCLKRFGEILGKPGLEAVAISPDGEIAERLSIFTGPAERLRELQKRYHSFGKLAKRYVSGRVHIP